MSPGRRTAMVTKSRDSSQGRLTAPRQHAQGLSVRSVSARRRCGGIRGNNDGSLLKVTMQHGQQSNQDHRTSARSSADRLQRNRTAQPLDRRTGEPASPSTCSANREASNGQTAVRLKTKRGRNAERASSRRVPEYERCQCASMEDASQGTEVCEDRFGGSLQA